MSIDQRVLRVHQLAFERITTLLTEDTPMPMIEVGVTFDGAGDAVAITVDCVVAKADVIGVAEGILASEGWHVASNNDHTLLFATTEDDLIRFHAFDDDVARRMQNIRENMLRRLIPVIGGVEGVPKHSVEAIFINDLVPVSAIAVTAELTSGSLTDTDIDALREDGWAVEVLQSRFRLSKIYDED